MKGPRFKVGNFFQGKAKSGHEGLWCILAIYRTAREPNIWRFILERRKNLNDPKTPLSEDIHRTHPPRYETVWMEPVRDGSVVSTAMMRGNAYAHGDWCHVTTQQMLNEFKFVAEEEEV